MCPFELLDLKHRELVEGYLRRFPPEISEHTFTNLFAWRRSRPLLLLETEAALLFVVEQNSDLAVLGPPVGGLSIQDALALLKGVTNKTLSSFQRIPEGDVGDLPADEDRDNYDYVYRRSDLAELAGRKYHAKRNLVERCTATNECVYEEIAADNLGEVGELQERWCEERNCGRDVALCHEYQAIRAVLDNYQRLGVFGAAVRVNGRLEAYTIGEALNDQTAVVHFEKAMSQPPGLYQVVNQWFCRGHLDRFEYVNREQDLGIVGLRKAKKSYRPDHMVKKYLIRVAPGGAVLNDATHRCPE